MSWEWAVRRVWAAAPGLTNEKFRDDVIDFFDDTARCRGYIDAIVGPRGLEPLAVNLRFVEAFVWVARLQSVTRAAEKLFLTQSAVSSRIATLEDELGAPLLDRRDRVFRLTSAGTRFLDYAERLLALQREVRRELGAPEQLLPSLRVGGIETVLHTWLIPLVASTKAHSPQLEFELTVEMTPVLNDQVRRGGLDLIFSAAPAAGQGVVTEPLPPMEMVFAGRREGRRPRRLGLDELMSAEIMTFQRGSQPHAALLETLQAEGLGHKRVHSISSISALVKLVESGFGVATLPRAVVEQLAPQHGIAALATGLALPPLPLHVSYRHYPAAPELASAIAHALDFARRAAHQGG